MLTKIDKLIKVNKNNQFLILSKYLLKIIVKNKIEEEKY